MSIKLTPPYYPIVYVRGYAMTEGEREETFHDTYYGFAATSVEKRDAPPPDFARADMFEGQLIRLMKLGSYAYFDSTNEGLMSCADPSRSVWVCRFYDEDIFKNNLRSIEEHATDLYRMIYETIPSRLNECGVDLGKNNEDYKVILLAHSMGGLVCRTLIQNILPGLKEDPKKTIHRLVTFGTPHKGIELGRIPDFMEKFVLRKVNPFDANIFDETRMRQYLKLAKTYEPHSLGDPKSPYAFPVKRCLCLIGSDYQSYSAVQHVTGDFSDGLVKQDRAYVVAGKPDAKGKYASEQKSFWANIHRAHSGRRGIVNSYESFENLRRFLFGNIKADVFLESITIETPVLDKTEYFYDIEFLLSIRGLPVYLHRREQDPCENAIRYSRDELEQKRVQLHTLFMSSALKTTNTNYSHFKLEFRVRELAIKKGFLWDHDYPEKSIYTEDLEIRVGDFDEKLPGQEVQYRWLSEGGDWQNAEKVNQGYSIPLRKAGALSGRFFVAYGPWPDGSTQD